MKFPGIWLALFLEKLEFMKKPQFPGNPVINRFTYDLENFRDRIFELSNT